MQEKETPVCNHTSVGIVVFDAQKRLLLIERKKPPYGFACPAGHVEDHETYEEAAIRELREEVGLQVVTLARLLTVTMDNQCRRPDGTYHQWGVYWAHIIGTIATNEDEVKRVIWATPRFLQEL